MNPQDRQLSHNGTLPLLDVDAIAAVAAAANRCPLLLPPQLLPLCITLFSLMMFKILLRPSIILNIFHVTFWLIVVCPRTAFAFATVACPCRCVFANLLVVITTCAASTVSCLSLTMMGGGDEGIPQAYRITYRIIGEETDDRLEFKK